MLGVLALLGGIGGAVLHWRIKRDLLAQTEEIREMP
jgi:hypothetical protein